jgi:2-polyprenyl-3-methyl-5-hydroxy-6-metoxy-1,4-benzoquinol methylase
MIAEARRRANTRGLEVRFEESALLDLRPAEPDYDLVICCEVLEHVEDPEAALRHLKSLCRGHLLFSVPREPIWRVLNVVRGKYLRTFGNTPGHLQHWSAAAFRAFLRQHVRVVKYLTPFPWSMALCRSEPADDNRRRRPGPENA